MGFAGIGLGELLLVLIVFILVFGTKKLSTFGSDLGQALRGFREAMRTEETPPPSSPPSLSHTPLSSEKNTSAVDQPKA